MTLSKFHKFTVEQIDFIKENAKNRYNKELTELFNCKFNLDLSIGQITNCKGRYNISSGLTGQFVKGQNPYNKGTKGLMKPNRTSFKKGNMPKNHRPVGSIRLSKDGYVEVKIAEPNKWRLKHLFIWEQKFGPVPKGHAVVFLDGNKLNLTLENLSLIPRSQLLILNRRGLIYNDPDNTKTGILIAEIIDKGNKRLKK